MTKPATLDRTEYGWTWRPLNARLETLCLGQRVSFDCVEDGQYWVRVRVAGPFRLVDSTSGREQEFDFEKPVSGSEALVELLHRGIANLEIYEDGTLRVFFGSGTALVVPPAVEYEAWTLSDSLGASGLKVVCGIGGEIHIFG